MVGTYRRKESSIIMPGAPHPRFDTLSPTRPVKTNAVQFDVRFSLPHDPDDPDGSQRIGLLLKDALRSRGARCVTATRVRPKPGRVRD